MIGLRRPLHQSHRQKRRRFRSFVAFLVIEGEIDLIEDQGDGREQAITVPAGELRIHAPHRWQRHRHPFPVGSAFLWWHVDIDARYHRLGRDAAAAMLERQQAAGRQTRWLIPLQLDCRPILGELGTLHRQLEASFVSWGGRDPATTCALRWLMHRVHQRCSRVLLESEAAVGTSDQRHAQHALRLIREQVLRYSSLGELAAALDLDPAYLARCIKRATGRTAGDLILDARIDRAKGLLAREDLGLKEIAAQCGFGSLAYFSRRFKQATGHTASGYRRERAGT